MKPEVITKKHARIFWISMFTIAVLAVLLYGYGRFVPSPIAGQQAKSCEGARQALADLQATPDNVSADASKLKDAKQLAQIECEKVDKAPN